MNIRLHVLVSLVALAVAAPAIADVGAIQPGQWSVSTEIKTMQIEGMPPDLAQKMKGAANTSESCVTPEKAAQGFRNATQKDADCPVKTATMSGGMLDATSICEKNGSTRTMHFHGPFTPTGYSLDVDSSATGKHPMTMTMKVVAKRVGECK